jgi:Ca2+-binding RTX toxin-like protein
VFNTIKAWLSKPSKAAKRPNRMILQLHPLEDRFMPAVTRQALLDTFNTGVAVVRDAAAVTKVVQTVAADVPLVAENLSQVTKLADSLQAALAAVTDPGAAVDPDLQQIARALEQAVPGTTVQRLSLSPDANNNLVLVTYDKDITITPQFTVGGQTGFSYFDDHVNGRLGGSLAAGPVKVRVHLEYGVDLVNGVPSFYVAANDPTKNPKPLLAVDPITLTGAVSGNLAIKSLANVTASGAASGSLAGQVTLADTADGVNDGRVRASALGASARGTVTGSLNLPDLKFTVKVPVLDSITWSGKLGGSFVGNVFKATDIQFTSKPDAMQLLKQAASGLLSKFAGDNLPLLGDKSFLDLLNKAQDKLGGVSVLSKLGLSLDSVKSLAPKALGAITGATNLAGLRAALGSKFQVLPAYKDTELDKAVTDLINGKQVELIRYTNSLEKEWKDSASVSSPPIPLLPGLTASGSLGVEGNVGGRLFVGVGVDTTGAFIDPKTSFTLYGGARAFAEGSLTLFGLAGASVDVGVGAKLEAGVKLNDPDPTDGKIYLDEVLNPNKGVLDSLLASTKLFAQAEANGFVRAKLELPWPLPDVTLFEKEFAAESLWSFSKDNKVLTPDGKTTFRALALTPDQPLDVDALVRVENGQRVLVLDGSAEANGIDVRLSRTEDGKVKVTWFGKGEGTVANIARVRFVGSPTADRLDVDPTLTVPIIADGGAGNDFLSGGAGNDTLSGGAGADELIGQGGNDVLTGGAGRNILRGGAGNDLLTAGDDGDMLFGDDGADTLIGGAGGDVMDGGAGNDVMDGGAGNDQMLGGLGSDTMSGGDGNDVMDGGDGNDVMDGGAGDDIMDGGAGSDTMSGGLGKDRMGGGAGADRIDGGDGNDIVRGGAGNDTLLGGNGNDLLGGRTGSRSASPTPTGSSTKSTAARTGTTSWSSGGWTRPPGPSWPTTS